MRLPSQTREEDPEGRPTMGPEEHPASPGEGRKKRREKPSGTQPGEDGVRLDRPIWFYVVRRALRNFLAHRAVDLAAALTYYGVFAVGPALIALVSTLGILGRSEEVVAALLEIVEEIAPPTAVESVAPVIGRIASSPAAGVALVLGLLGALWSVSAYVAAFGRTMNTVFQVEEGRPVWKLRPQTLLITAVLLVVVAVVATAVVVTGPIAMAVGRVIGLGDATVAAWNFLKWPVVLLLVVLVVSLLYYGTPNVRRPHSHLLSTGAVIAIVVWIGASFGLAYYVSRFADYDRTYGSLGGFIVFLLWLWITNIALVFGAELDAEIERSRELRAGIASEVRLHLPLRDESGIEKRRRQDAESVAIGRAIRRHAQKRADRRVPDPRPGRHRRG